MHARFDDQKNPRLLRCRHIQEPTHKNRHLPLKGTDGRNRDQRGHRVSPIEKTRSGSYVFESGSEGTLSSPVRQSNRSRPGRSLKTRAIGASSSLRLIADDFILHARRCWDEEMPTGDVVAAGDDLPVWPSRMSSRHETEASDRGAGAPTQHPACRLYEDLEECRSVCQNAETTTIRSSGRPVDFWPALRRRRRTCCGTASVWNLLI